MTLTKAELLEAENLGKPLGRLCTLNGLGNWLRCRFVWQAGANEMAIASILRAVFGYCFLILIARIAGRRPGKQLTPFEFVLIFYLGGLTLTGIVSNEASLTNAVCQIITLALCHYGLARWRAASPRVARILDGMPLILLEGSRWRTTSLQKMRIQDDDVMAMARDKSMRQLSEIDTAVLERNGEITILPKKDSDAGGSE